MTAPQPKHNDAADQVQRMAARAITLYSRPTVAMEIMRLTEQPQINTEALKACIEQDPALTCKILRVVNSSLFGLTSRVADLTQALNLLGIKPLKLLVLGFSLPDSLFADLAARELRWYWTTTLTRAVAARLISENLWHKPGDEPFIAGLLEDIGALVMLRELGRPYAKFLSGAIDEHCNVAGLERTTLGFDHVQLSALLLARWQLPQKLIDAISAPRQTPWLTRQQSPEGDLPRVLHMADLLAQLVGQRRLRVLPELLEAGAAYCEMTKPQLTELVGQLQTQVDQLAEALSLELNAGRDYAHILCEAHEKMGILTEEVVANLRRPEDEAYARLRTETDELTGAMKTFLGEGAKTSKKEPTTRRENQDWAAPGQFHGNSALMRRLLVAAGRCRQRRHELSLLLVEAQIQDAATFNGPEVSRRVRSALGRACATFENENVAMVSLSDRRAAAVLCDCERNAALAAAHLVMRNLGATKGHSAEPAASMGITLSAGVATAAVVPKNFDPAQLIDSAERCLNASRLSGVSTVKSIEV